MLILRFQVLCAVHKTMLKNWDKQIVGYGQTAHIDKVSCSLFFSFMQRKLVNQNSNDKTEKIFSLL